MTINIHSLKVGDTIGPYEVVEIAGEKIAIADHSADADLGTARAYNVSRRWYKLTSPTLAGKLNRAASR